MLNTPQQNWSDAKCSSAEAEERQALWSWSTVLSETYMVPLSQALTLTVVKATVVTDERVEEGLMYYLQVISLGSFSLKWYDRDNARCFTFRVKTKTAAKYGLSAQPRLVDIIAAVPPQYRKVLVPKLKAKPIRTASGVSTSIHVVLIVYLSCQKFLPPCNAQ